MKYLYVIGNGFDIHHKIPSRYLNFKDWLEENDEYTYSKVEEILGVWQGDDMWWNEFETNLGEVDVIKEYTENVAFENQPNYASDDYHDGDLYDAEVEIEQELGGLMENLKDDFQQWACKLPAGDGSKIVKIEKEDSFFLTFNYSLTLEKKYGIPGNQILHIHGIAYDKDSIEMGHGRSYKEVRDELDNDLPVPPNDLSAEEYAEWYQDREDEVADDYPTIQAKDAAASAVCSMQKDVEGIIKKNKPFFDSLKKVEEVHVYGFSFATTDMPYLEKIIACIRTEKVLFEASWFSEKDKDRIEAFVEKYKERFEKVKLVKLEEIQNYTMPSLF